MGVLVSQKHGTVFDIQRHTPHITPKKSWHVHYSSTPKARHARGIHANQRNLPFTTTINSLPHALRHNSIPRDHSRIHRWLSLHDNTSFSKHLPSYVETPGSARSMSIRIHTKSGRRRSPTKNEIIVLVPPPGLTQPDNGSMTNRGNQHPPLPATSQRPSCLTYFDSHFVNPLA